MNQTNPQPEHDEDLAPLDAFEQQWVDQLAQREPDLVQSEDAFVESVMRQAEAPSSAVSPPAVLARIGTAALPYAIAAAVLLAGVVGWAVLNDSMSDADQPPVVGNDDPTQPIDGSAVAQVDRPKVALGSLIANAKATATNPADTLTTTVNEVPKAVSIDRLFELLDEGVPDLKELLEPLEPKDEQSRA